MKLRRGTPEFSISFLDVICCGFGAVILLLMITKTVQPQILEDSTIVADGQVSQLTTQLRVIRGDTKRLNRELDAKRNQISQYVDNIAILQGSLASAKSNFISLNKAQTTDSATQQDLSVALQKLSDLEKRLLENNTKEMNQLIGGIPADSEYIVFVIDTSGSMENIWPMVVNQVFNAVDIYPTVKGFKVFNGDGVELRLSNATRQGGWISGDVLKYPSTKQALNAFRFNGDSSTLKDGIMKAVTSIRGFREPVSIYVFADDLSPSVRPGDLMQPSRIISRRVETESTLSDIRSLAKKKVGMLRIHVIAFPDYYRTQSTLWEAKNKNFLNFARNLTAQNNGSLVALNR
jgi:hypothetical protein